MKRALIPAWIAVLLLPASAPAHVVLEDQTAPASSYYKAVFRVGHGCDGAATTSITVRLPEPMASVKPMVKPGWTLTMRTEAPATPLMHHGRPVSEAVVEVTWAGGPLPDAHYDEFALMLKLPATPGRRWFKVKQMCERGENDWSQIPADGQTTQGLKMPAARLDIEPAGEKPHH